MVSLTKGEKINQLKFIHTKIKKLMTRFLILIGINLIACITVNFLKTSQVINITLFGILGALTATTIILLVTRLIINHKINNLEYFSFTDGDRLDTVVISGCNSSQMIYLPMPAPIYSESSKRPPSYVSAI